MTKLLVSLALSNVVFSPAALADEVQKTIRETIVHSNDAIVDKAFANWQSGQGSFYNLLTGIATVMISGHSPHSGTFFKAQFLKDRAKPFQARFSTPLVPTHWKIWAVNDEVVVRWESRATACDGKPYRNSYAYFITMKEGRAEALTMFLDMGAFDDVWSRCSPADLGEESKQ